MSLWNTEFEQWKKDGKGIRPKKPSKIKTSKTELDISDLGMLPKNWKWIKIGDFEELIGSGSTPRGGQNTYQDKGIRFIRSQNVLFNQLWLEEVAYISPFIHENMNRSQVKEHDVLLNITGASIGRAAFVPTGFGEANVNQHVCIIRCCTPLINYKYLTLYLNSPHAQSIIKKINSGATREALTFNQIRNFPFPLAPKEEQEMIVEQLEEKFSVIENLKSTIQGSLLQAETLKQSFLKEVFYGKLVDSDSKDEPALRLLEIIRDEKKNYLDLQSQQINKKTKSKKVMGKEELGILDILKQAKEPKPALEVWQESRHKDSIENFYAELKTIHSKISETRKGTESFLELINEN